MVTPVQINNDGNGNSRFGCCYRDNKNGKKDSFQLLRVEIFIECHKVYVDTIQYKLNRHQHRDDVSPRKESIHANKKQGGTDK
jgi:hypothetical protein